MNGFIHHLPTPNKPLPAQNTYGGEATQAFAVLLMLCDLFDGKDRTDFMSAQTFDSLPLYCAFMGAGWADAYAHR